MCRNSDLGSIYIVFAKFTDFFRNKVQTSSSFSNENNGC